jgi:hypothetical protein
MLDVFFIKKVLYLRVLELGVVVTSYLLNLSIKLILCPSEELLKHLLCFTLILQKEHSSEMGIIIKNDNTVFVTANANVDDRTKHVHV